MVVETAKKLNDEVKEIRDIVVSQIGEMVIDGDTDAVKLISNMFKALDLSMQLLAEQAQLMTDINNKLDALTRRKEIESM